MKMIPVLLLGIFMAGCAPMFRTFVGRCLGERGYEVIGWK